MPDKAGRRHWAHRPLASYKKSPKKYVLDSILEGLVVIVLARVPARQCEACRQKACRQ